MINLSHFYYFHLTAKYGGVTKAAEVLKIAQPSLSSQIKVFEASLGKKLFRKNGRKLELTPEGVIAYSFSKKIFEIVEEFEKYNTNNLSENSIRSRIGVAREVERPFVAEVLSRILKKHKEKKTNLLMTTGNHSELMKQMLANEIDVLVTNTPTYTEGIVTLASLFIPVVPVASPYFINKMKISKHSSLQKILSSDDLCLVLPTHQLKLRFETDVFLQKYHICDAGVFESDILSAVVRATVEGTGIAFLPRVYIEKELSSGSLILLDKKTPVWSHKIYLTSVEDKNFDPVILEVKKFFENYKTL